METSNINKHELFDVFLQKLINKVITIENREDNEVNRKKVRDSFSATWLMKMLYFTCLSSVSQKDSGLFKYFNNFEAYPNGPVEVDIYESLD